MKKLNFDIIIKIIILLGFSIFYLKLILSNEILRYVHPRIIPFAIFGMIFMFIIALFLITESLHNKKRKIKFKNYAIFIFPLIMIVFMQSTSANSAIKTSGLTANGNSSISSKDNSSNNSSTTSYELYSGKTVSDGQGNIEKKELDMKENVIQVNSKNFVFSLDEILGNPDKYEGKEIEISGFVYRDVDLKENQFIIGRFMMVCCAADMQVAGIRCDGKDLQAYTNDTWIKVKGKIKKDTYDGEVDPLIIVENIEKDPNPDTSYVYPF